MPQTQPSRQQPEGLGSDAATLRAEPERKAEYPVAEAPQGHSQAEGAANGHGAQPDAGDTANGYGSSVSNSPTDADQPDLDGPQGADDRKRGKKKGRPRSRKNTNTGPGKDGDLSALMAGLQLNPHGAMGMGAVPPHMMPQQFGSYGPNMGMGPMGPVHPMGPMPPMGQPPGPYPQHRPRRMTGDGQQDAHGPQGQQGQGQGQGQQGGRRHRDLFPVGTYKTEICRSHLQTGYCEYGPNCQFAHGIHELRPRHFDVKYKTQLCKNYHKDGNCRFGSRCKFIHDEHRIQVDANEFWLVSPSENLVRVEIVENPQRRAQLQLLVETPPPPPPVDPALANSPAAKELEDRRKLVLDNARVAASRAAYARQQGQQPFLGGNSGGVPVQVGVQGPSMGPVAAPGGPMGGVTVSPPMPMPFAKPPAHMPNSGPSPVPMGANPAFMNGPVPPPAGMFPGYFAGPPPMYPMPPMGVYPQLNQQAQRF